MRKKGEQPREERTVRERVADNIDASKEILLNSVKVVFIGNREVTIENYKGIVEYTDSRIVLEANPHKLKIDGVGLEVRCITQELLYVTGTIWKMEFQREA